MKRLTWKKTRMFMGSTAYKTFLNGKTLYLERLLSPDKYRILVTWRDANGEMAKFGFSIEDQKSTQKAKKVAEYLLQLHVAETIS